MTLVREHFEHLIRSASDLELWQPDASQRPDVVLCIVESGAGLHAQRPSPLLDPWPRAVLYDAAGRLGPLGAGLHHFLGYLPPDVSRDRMLRCLYRVATGETDAPRPHYETLVRVLAMPPLDERDREVMRLLALGRSHQQIRTALGLKERTFESHLAQLVDRFEASSGHHLGAVAVALGLAWPWAGDTPDGW